MEFEEILDGIPNKGDDGSGNICLECVDSFGWRTLMYIDGLICFYDTLVNPDYLFDEDWGWLVIGGKFDGYC